MSILDFVAQEELESLEDDPQAAFLDIVRHARGGLAAKLAQLSSQEDWDERETTRQHFFNVVVTVGKGLELEPFVSMAVPLHADIRSDQYKAFQEMVNQAITQVVMQNTRRSKKTSVEIRPNSKERIRLYILNLRECIQNADMDAAKRDVLLHKIDEFEVEIDKKRFKLAAVTMLLIGILGAPGAIAASYDVAKRLVTNITEIVAEDKRHEDETLKIAPPAQPRALPPPRQTEEPSRDKSDLANEIEF